MFGMEVDEKSGSVFAKKVASNGLGKKAGLQVGDIIMTINGKKPTTRSEAVDMLSLLPVGEEAVFTIQRADKTQELRVVAE
jgi:S1-C subfamily serine protease